MLDRYAERLAGMHGSRPSRQALTCLAQRSRQVTQYFISKRTDVYFVGALAHDHAHGDQIEAALGSASSTSFQAAARIGIRHTF